jgi:hypothetical protein
VVGCVIVWPASSCLKLQYCSSSGGRCTITTLYLGFKGCSITLRACAGTLLGSLSVLVPVVLPPVWHHSLLPFSRVAGVLTLSHVWLVLDEEHLPSLQLVNALFIGSLLICGPLAVNSTV